MELNDCLKYPKVNVNVSLSANQKLKATYKINQLQFVVK